MGKCIIICKVYVCKLGMCLTKMAKQRMFFGGQNRKESFFSHSSRTGDNYNNVVEMLTQICTMTSSRRPKASGMTYMPTTARHELKLFDMNG